MKCTFVHAKTKWLQDAGKDIVGEAGCEELSSETNCIRFGETSLRAQIGRDTSQDSRADRKKWSVLLMPFMR